MCVVIGLQSTGEQRTSEEVDRIRAEEQELTEMVSSCKGVFRRLLEHHFPVSDRSKLESLGIDFGIDSEEEGWGSNYKFCEKGSFKQKVLLNYILFYSVY